MGPWLVGRQVLPVRKGNIDGVEADDEIFGTVDLLEDSDDTRFGSDAPGKALVGSTVVLNPARMEDQESDPRTLPFRRARYDSHSLLRDDGQALLSDGARVVSLIA